jgi:hypothetical protein
MKNYLFLFLIATLAFGCGARREPSLANAGEPWASLRTLGDALHQAADVGQSARAAGSDRENASGGRFLAETTVLQLGRAVFSDPDHPVFRPTWPESAHVGLSNPDNLYESTPIRPGVNYLVRGTRGSTADLVLQVYETSPGVKGSLRGVSTLSLGDLELGEDGSFEIHVGPARQAQNWLLTDATSGMLLVRWSHSDWATERAGRVEIVPVGGDGLPSPDLDVADVARKLRDAGAAIPDASQFWLDFINRIRLFTGKNEVMKPRVTGEGGLDGQVSAMGQFSLADDEALIVTVPRTDARYQGMQLGNYWFDALEWANRQTSLAGGQARLGSDGRYHYVIAVRDPGVPNWLDTTGLTEGVFLLRFQGLKTEIGADDLPETKLVKLTEIGAHLPDDTPKVDAAARREQLAARQIQLQRRYGR